MNIKLAFTAAKAGAKAIGRTTGYFLKKHAPEILEATGILSMVAGTIIGCKQTLKANDILAKQEEEKATIEAVHNGEVELKEGETYTDEDYRKDLALNRVGTIKAFAKNYIIPVGLEVAGILCIIGGHNIMASRNAGLAAAVTTLTNGWNQYRKNVIDELGEDADKRFRYGLKQKEFDGYIDGETGEMVEHKGKKPMKAEVVDDSRFHSVYSRWFDQDFTSRWTPSQAHNLFELQRAESWCNDQLRARGWLSLNEVYEYLGFEKTKEGQVVGWVYDDDPDHNFVTFMIYQMPINRAAVNMLTNATLLDFNVRPIYNDIPSPIYDFRSQINVAEAV